MVFFTHMCSNVGPHIDYIIRLHDQKNHFAPHFTYLDPRSASVPLTMLLASFNPDAIVTGISDPKVMVHVISVVIDLRTAMVALMTPLASHDTDANTYGIT